MLKCLNLEARLETRPPLDLKHGRSISAMALSPDGRMAALVTGGKSRLLDTTTGEELVPAIPSQARIGLVFSSDNRMLVTVDSQVGWWDTATGKPIALDASKLQIYSNWLRDGQIASDFLSLSADGLTLAVGGQSVKYRSSSFSVFRMNRDTREVDILLNRTDGDMGTIRVMQISPDGESVIASQYFSGSLSRFSATDGRKLESNSSEHESAVAVIGFNADGTALVTGSVDGMIKVWKDYRELTSPETDGFLGHAGEIQQAAFITDGKRLISSGADQTVRLWDLGGKSVSLAHTLDHLKSGDGIVFSPDGLLVACADKSQNRLGLWDPATGRLVRSFKRDGKGLLCSVRFPQTDECSRPAMAGQIRPLWWNSGILTRAND